MMAAGPRVVAELGRPETPDETVARKAESSRVYRSSQTTRNLVAALLATLAIVLVIVVAVPRGSVPASSIDVAAVAKDAASTYGRTVIVPDAPSSWRVNSAAVSGDAVPTWTVVYSTGESGYLRIAQGFDADPAWDARLLSGASADGSVTVDGIAWTRYAIPDPARAGNVSYAIGTDAGKDRVLIYGMTDAAHAATAAKAVAAQIRTLREETP
jgi:hypothetical protein